MKAKKIGVKHAILGRSDTNLPLRRRYDLARRIMGTDLDLKTAREMSAGSKESHDRMSDPNSSSAQSSTMTAPPQRAI